MEILIEPRKKTLEILGSTGWAKKAFEFQGLFLKVHLSYEVDIDTWYVVLLDKLDDIYAIKGIEKYELISIVQ